MTDITIESIKALLEKVTPENVYIDFVNDNPFDRDFYSRPKDIVEWLMKENEIVDAANRRLWTINSDLELRFQAARNVAVEYESIDENGVSKWLTMDQTESLNKEIEKEFQRLKAAQAEQDK